MKKSFNPVARDVTDPRCIVTTNFLLPPVPQTSAEAFYNVDVAITEVKAEIINNFSQYNTAVFIENPTEIANNISIISVHNGNDISMPVVADRENQIFHIQNLTNLCIRFNGTSGDTFVSGDVESADFVITKYCGVSLVAKAGKWHVLTF